MQSITRDDLKRMNDTEHEDFVLINVLPTQSFNEQHIRTSVNVPADNDNFVQQTQSIAGKKERKIVVYCASFDCDASTKAAKKLEQAGFTQVYDYEGGTRDWFARKQAS
jgi:rhodanese-related sulfurtransferase